MKKYALVDLSLLFLRLAAAVSFLLGGFILHLAAEDRLLFLCKIEEMLVRKRLKRAQIKQFSASKIQNNLKS